jgi:multicomponent Na+:H+ antiporter subunit C
VIILLSAAIAALVGTGVFLMLKPDLVRVVVGMALFSNAANLALIAAGLERGREPIYPLPAGEPLSDPLVQAMTLTAIVIGFGVTALLLCLVYRVYATHRSVDLDELVAAEEREEHTEEDENELDEVVPEAGGGMMR